MPKYILLRFFPAKPIEPPTEFNELLGNGNFTVNLYDIDFANPSSGTAITPTINYADLIQHDDVLASVVFPLAHPFTNEYESRDIRVEITRNSTVILDKVFNFNILVFDNPPNPTHKKPSVYIPIPIPEDSLVGATLNLSLIHI